MHGLLLVLVVGAGAGFLGGLLGKGGSAVATPVLAALGVPPLVAVAAPLPATIPGTLLAARRYRERGLVADAVVRRTVLVGVPATVLGAAVTRWVDAGALVGATDVVLVAIGASLLLGVTRRTPAVDEAPGTARVVGVALAAGLAAGLLANSGGFLLAPLFITVLGLPVKPALGSSLAAAAALAVPGALVHLALGHLDWRVVLVFAAGSVPFAQAGARLAVATDPDRLERAYGAALVALGAGLLLLGRR